MISVSLLAVDKSVGRRVKHNVQHSNAATINLLTRRNEKQSMKEHR